jgi:hypothetical protein
MGFKGEPVTGFIDVAVVALGSEIIEVVAEMNRANGRADKVPRLPVRTFKAGTSTGIAGIPVSFSGDPLTMLPELLFELCDCWFFQNTGSLYSHG